MNPALKILLVVGLLCSAGYFAHAVLAWRVTRRLQRMAAAERARRHDEYCQAKMVNFPQAMADLPDGIRPPSTARRMKGGRA